MNSEKKRHLRLLAIAVKRETQIEHDPKTFLGQRKLRRIARQLAQNPEDETTLKILEQMDSIDIDNEMALNIIPGVEAAIRTDIHIPNHLNYFMPGHSYVESGLKPRP